MIDVRFQKEIQKFKEEDIYEEDENINFFKYRHNLKEIILNILDDNRLLLSVTSFEQMKIIKEYKSFLLRTKKRYPRFIFDEYDETKFRKCFELKMQGKTIEETEKYYLNEICKNSKTKQIR